MGRRGGPIKRREPLEHPGAVVDDDQVALATEQAIEALVDGGLEEVRKIARAAAPKAVRKLERLMRSPKTPASVQRTCAKDLIEIAYGADALGGEEKAQRGGLIINILRITDGRVEPREERDVTAQEIRDDVADALQAFEEVATPPLEQDPEPDSIPLPTWSPEDA